MAKSRIYDSRLIASLLEQLSLSQGAWGNLHRVRGDVHTGSMEHGVNFFRWENLKQNRKFRKIAYFSLFPYRIFIAHKNSYN
jgi:hypothetical protein